LSASSSFSLAEQVAVVAVLLAEAAVVVLVVEVVDSVVDDSEEPDAPLPRSRTLPRTPRINTNENRILMCLNWEIAFAFIPH